MVSSAGHIYFLTNPALGNKWTDAEAQAVAAGGHLVTINDANEQAWLNKTFVNYVPYGESSVRESYWIGLRDPVGDNTSDSWVSGESLTYTHWAPRPPGAPEEFGEPSSSYEQYDELNPLSAPGYWNDRTNDASPIGGRGIVEVVAKVTGTPGNDTIYTRGGNVTIAGSAGNDTISGDQGNDVIRGGEGNDLLHGYNGNDKVYGDNGNDKVYGENGDDRLYGGNGNDSLNGGAGNDLLVGGLGNDLLVGDIGTDSFAFNAPNEGRDTIIGFSVQDDTIRIYGFGHGLTPGKVITADQFFKGVSAADRNDRFIYNPKSGALFFDPDGRGGSSQVQLVQLAPGLAMTHNDIYIANIPA